LHSVSASSLQHGVEHPVAWDGGQQSDRSLLKGGEVGHDLHADLGGEIGVVSQVAGEAAVVETQELLEHQAG
jgi:hypothetical protein